MTLKEKFETKSSIDTAKEAKVFASECEKVADEFAIGFAEWLNYKNYRAYSNGWANFETKAITIKELLEIYKKENYDK